MFICTVAVTFKAAISRKFTFKQQQKQQQFILLDKIQNIHAKNRVCDGIKEKKTGYLLYV